MYRPPTPLRQTRSARARAASIVLKVSGTVTVLCLLGLARPAAIAAQAIGTMQVVARVTPAGASWAGLSAAQQVAREFATTPNAGGPRRLDLSLSQVRLEFPPPNPAGHPVQPAISIQYLHN